ncbi:MAG: ribonuclease [Mycobacterium sp.]|nr:ribonuclease [Mycobacterium sp.]
MGAREKVGSTVGTMRRRAPWLDHFVRAWSRYQSDSGDRLAASVTYFGFLSFFPLIALAFSVAGFVVDAYPSAQHDLVRQINNFLPGLSDKLNVATIGDAKVATGIIGILGLLLAGLGWIDALREAIRTMWHHNLKAGNFITKKLVDIGLLVGLGLTMAASVAVTGVSSSAMGWFLKEIGLEGSTVANVLLRIAGYALAIGVDIALFLFLLIRLPKVATPFRQVLKGALLGAVGFEILKTLGSLLVKGTTHNPVYGIFAVVVGLLIWINYLSRFTLFVAAWTVTAPFDTDVRPSGTADVAMAEEAGIPTEYVSSNPNDVSTTAGEGAPSPLAEALTADPSKNGSARMPVVSGAADLSGRVNLQKRADAYSPSTEKAKAAGYIGVGMMAAGAMGVAWSGLKTVREFVRR